MDTFCVDINQCEWEYVLAKSHFWISRYNYRFVWSTEKYIHIVVQHVMRVQETTSKSKSPVPRLTGCKIAIFCDYSFEDLEVYVLRDKKLCAAVCATLYALNKYADRILNKYSISTPTEYESCVESQIQAWNIQYSFCQDVPEDSIGRGGCRCGCGWCTSCRTKIHWEIWLPS